MRQQHRASPHCLGAGFPEHAFGAMAWCSGGPWPSAMQAASEGQHGVGPEAHLAAGAGCVEEPVSGTCKAVSKFCWLRPGLGLCASRALLLFHSLCQLSLGVLVHRPGAVLVSFLPQAADGEPDWSGGTRGFRRHEGTGAAVSICGHRLRRAVGTGAAWTREAESGGRRGCSGTGLHAQPASRLLMGARGSCSRGRGRSVIVR